MVQIARGKALVAKLRRQAGVRDPEALAAYLGRFKKARKAGKSAGEAAKVARGGGSSNGPSKSGNGNGLSEPPDMDAAWDDMGDNISERQAAYLRALRGKDLINPPVGPSFVGTRADLPKHALAVNLPVPKSKQQASEMIDDLKSGGVLAYARSHSDYGKQVLNTLAKRYGKKYEGFQEAWKKRYSMLSPEQRRKAQNSNRAMRRYVLDPLLRA